MYYMLDAKIPPWPQIKVSLTSLSPQFFGQESKRRDLLSSPLRCSFVQVVLQPTPSRNQAGCITRRCRKKAEKSPFVFATEPQCHVVCEVMAESNFKALRQTHETGGQRGAAGLRSGWRSEPLCRQDRLFTVAANELGLWPPRLGGGPGAGLPLVPLYCFYGFMVEEWAGGEMAKLSTEREYVGFHAVISDTYPEIIWQQNSRHFSTIFMIWLEAKSFLSLSSGQLLFYSDLELFILS